MRYFYKGIFAEHCCYFVLPFFRYFCRKRSSFSTWLWIWSTFFQVRYGVV